MMITCIPTKLQTCATIPRDNRFKLFLPSRIAHVRMLNNNTCFRSCSIRLSDHYNLFVDQPSIVKSSNCIVPFCNLFDRNKSKLIQTLSRMLASSVLLLAVMTMPLFCMQDNAFAASYGRMGGGAAGSLESSSSSSSSDDYYVYQDNDNSSCNCSKRPSRKIKRRSCTICDCYKEKNKGKPESCTDCNCYKEKESSANTVPTSSLPTNCDCNCHIPCKCSCHLPVKTIAKPMFITLFIGGVICLILEEYKNAYNMRLSDGEALDNRWGSVIMVQVWYILVHT